MARDLLRLCMMNAETNDRQTAGDTLVIMPCYNEQGRIGDVVRAVKAALPSATVLVVDDASADLSAGQAVSAGATVISHGCNLGYGAALETGYLYAIRGHYETVLQMDGDGQHLADQLPILLKPLRTGATDIVIGSRYHDGIDTAESSRLRHAGHKAFAFMLFLLSGVKFSDPTSGFQGLSRRAVALFASGVFPCDYPDSDVILMASMSGLRLLEVPVVMKARAGGKSMHSGLRPLYYCIKMLLSTFIVLLNFPTWHRWQRGRDDHETVPASTTAGGT